MRIVIIEDEKEARELLRAIIEEECPIVEQIEEAGNLKDGVDLIRKVKPELVFLDIELPNESGINILNYFDKDEINFELIFTTAYSDYAIQAFDMNAIGYILKPLRANKIKDVVDKTSRNIQKNQIHEKLIELQSFVENNKFKKIGIPDNDGISFVPLDEIVHIEAYGMYSKMHMAKSDKVILVTKPLKFFSEVLEKNTYFFKPHRSHIINVYFVKQYLRKNRNSILLENGELIPITKEKRDDFLELVQNI